MQRTRGRQKSADDSTDELAGDSLLKNPAQLPIRASFQTTTSHFSRPNSSKTTEKDLDKPLPPIPLNEEGYKQKKGRPALTVKTTNLKVPTRPEKPPLRPKISHPVLQQDSEDNDNNTALRQVNGSSVDQSNDGPKNTAKDAELLQQKISNLMQQASAREALQSPEKKGPTKTDFLVKPSPLQKSRDAFSKATRVIAGRFGNSRRAATPNFRRPGPIESSPSSFKALEYTPEPRSRSPTIERRIAEGENLSNPKIPRITGDGSIPRKPLPIYESMKPQRRSTDSEENPFSDVNHTDPLHSSPSEFDFNFSRQRRNVKVSDEASGIIAGASNDDTTTTSVDLHPQPLQFSNKISGLAQHPDTMVFSSSPIGASTPRIRLEPVPAPRVDKKAQGSLKRTPSILEFSFEESQSDDSTAEPKSNDAADHSMSVKRRSAKPDLRSQLSPTASKRPRRSHDNDYDDLGLEIEFRQLSTSDNGTSVSQYSTANRMGKNIGTSEAEKVRRPLASAVGIAKRTKARTAHARRSLIPRPNSIMFSRESRAHFRLRDTTDGDTMDLDELQMEGAFSVESVIKK